MSTGWENLEAAPLEFFHGRLQRLFHEWRVLKFGEENTYPQINGIEFNQLINCKSEARNLR